MSIWSHPDFIYGLSAGCTAALGMCFLLRKYYCRRLEKEREKFNGQKFEIAERTLGMMELKEQLEEEQAQTQRLLRNILPERVIAELRDTGHSKPESFDSVAVFFSDIVDFTVRSSEIEPVVLIAELSEIFGEFDRIFAHHGCERIKTIGDAYMSVSGLPGGNSGHCRALLRAAMDARAFLERRNKKGPFVWQMRMGVHTGRVVGGIVGKEKYIYDIFGDTVNIAARMENYSEPMQINVSEAVYLQTADDFVFDPRPPADVKGKGAMRMYFLRSEKIRD